MKVYFDGGCRPNPGVIEAAVVARGVAYYRDDLGTGDNSDAEWCALIFAAQIAEQLGAHDVIFVGDSVLVINQAKGMQKCRSTKLNTILTSSNRSSPTSGVSGSDTLGDRKTLQALLWRAGIRGVKQQFNQEKQNDH